MVNRIYRNLTVNRSLKKQLVEHRGIYCEVCKERFYHQVHHIDKNRRNNNPNNLMLLCRICHNKQHGKLKEETS